VSEFEFEFGDAARDELLNEAADMVRGLHGDLGGGAGAVDPDAAVTQRLLELLNGDVAEFSAYPDVVQLERSHFSDRGLAVPAQFDALTQKHRFYWVRLPVTLAAPPEEPFRKLECAIELNPDEEQPHLRPRAHSILPDRRFDTKVAVDGGVDIHIGENLEFEAGLPRLSVPTPVGSASVAASVDAKVAAQAGVVVGPFKYRVRKARVTHSPAGTERVTWRLDGAEFVSEDDPTFIIVMQVPNGVENVQIAAALQAYHGFSLAEAGLAKTIHIFTSRLANFFRAGAPCFDKRLWDVSPSL
jgi:hypothetical protein